MKIERFHPSVSLNSFIKEFLFIESDLGMDNIIIPDLSMVMAFRFRGNVLMTSEEKKETLPASVVTGLRRTARLIHYAKATANLLVLLKEGGFNAFTKIPPHELFGQSVPTENIFRSTEINEIIDLLAEAESNSCRVKIMERFLIRKLIHQKRDSLVDLSIQLMKKHNGIIRIKDLVTDLHISQDPFEKRFRAQVGSSPKQYASIVRLRKLIANHSSTTSLTEASYTAGYFDQSHFIKDFRVFTGRTPKDFFAAARHW